MYVPAGIVGGVRPWLPTGVPSSNVSPIDASSWTKACIVGETAVCEENAARAPAAARTATASTTDM